MAIDPDIGNGNLKRSSAALHCFTQFQDVSIGMDTQADISGQLLDLLADMAAESLRLVPEGCKAVIEKNSYEVPAIFRLLAKEGGIDEHMMYHTYNMGIGMVLALPADAAEKAIAVLEEAGEKAYRIGRVEAGQKGVELI